MDTQPLISVIIPAYNAERFLPETLRSACAQTYRRLEIVVVDDGSTDGTADIARFFEAGDARVRLLQQKNAGVAAARNLGIAHSRGQFIAPLDADDVWYPRKLERQVEILLAADQSVGVVYSAWECIDEEGIILSGTRRSPGLEGDLSTVLAYRNVIACASNPLIRRRCIESVGGYSQRMFERGVQGCEDWDLYLRIAERYRFAASPDCLMAYRRRRSSMATSSTGMAGSFRIMMSDLEERRPDLPAALRQHARQRFYWYVSNLCSRDDERLRAAAWTIRSFLADPTVVRRLPLRKAFRRLAGLLLSPALTSDTSDRSTRRC